MRPGGLPSTGRNGGFSATGKITGASAAPSGSPDRTHFRAASSASISGKARVFMPLPGFRPYVEQCDEVPAKGYEGVRTS
jgi:hypothetical protein